MCANVNRSLVDTHAPFDLAKLKHFRRISRIPKLRIVRSVWSHFQQTLVRVIVPVDSAQLNVTTLLHLLELPFFIVQLRLSVSRKNQNENRSNCWWLGSNDWPLLARSTSHHLHGLQAIRYFPITKAREFFVNFKTRVSVIGPHLKTKRITADRSVVVHHAFAS